MSADRWSVCPLCEKVREAEMKKVADALVEQYGKLPRDKYLKLQAEAAQPAPDLEETVREDWEIGIYDGKFEVRYYASCNKCKFKFEFLSGEKPVCTSAS